MDTQQASQIAPPLDQDLATVDTAMPLLMASPNPMQFRVEKAEIKQTKDGKGQYISLELATTLPAQSSTGDNLGPGVRVFDNRNLVPTGKATWEMIDRGLGELVQSIEGGIAGAKKSNAAQWVPTLVGRTLKAKIGLVPAGVSKDGRSYKEKNEVTLYVKA